MRPPGKQQAIKRTFVGFFSPHDIRGQSGLFGLSQESMFWDWTLLREVQFSCGPPRTPQGEYGRRFISLVSSQEINNPTLCRAGAVDGSAAFQPKVCFL